MNKSLPAEIALPIDDAFKAMNAHPNHELLPFYRRTIYRGINQAAGLRAHKMKVISSIFSAERVAPYWRIPPFMVEEDEEDYDYWLNIPYHLIEMAKGVINGTIESAVVLKEANHLTEVDDFTGQMDNSPYYHEWCAFTAALNCVREALNLGLWKTVETDESITSTTTDEELKCQTDTAMLACLAYTGGSWTPTNPGKWYYDKRQNRWMPDNDHWYFEKYGEWNRNTELAITRRQEFWTWWLFEVTSEAWLIVQ